MVPVLFANIPERNSTNSSEIIAVPFDKNADSKMLFIYDIIILKIVSVPQSSTPAIDEMS
ncbi:hypothetical protein Ct61P_06857 [Colletotrichum tofieldiae]|nr:hypothetical protein Ct61P_06857 [Colletotrichum tofieldiae]